METSGLRRDIYIFEYEKESYPDIYNVEQFLPKEGDKPLTDSSELNNDFEEILEPTEISSEQKKINEEREKKFEAYLTKRPNFNKTGLFIYAYAKTVRANKDAIAYVELKATGLDLSPLLIANGFLKNQSDKDRELWHNKIPILIDIYYFDLIHKYEMNK
jgi:hypothetical protein